ncbi:MAG: hypothetical protein HXX13_03725 [Bacteroidetes bacterium]|nr:hypothetical protein [Bacteroidota bacterium]
MFKFLLVAICIQIIVAAKAQTVSDALKRGSAVTFFGIDFTKAKGVLIGASSTEMRDKYFLAINTLMVVEQQKYDIGKALYKSDVKVELRTVDELNQKIDTSYFKAYSSSEIVPLDKNTIQSIVRQYNLKDKTGIGLVFIAESLDKPGKLGTYYLVYFSMPEGNLILSEKVYGKPGGFGIRNFWAASIYSILKSDIQLKLEKKYLSK